MRTFKSFRIKLPSGERYWTVIDGSYRPVQCVDDWLLHLRVGRDCAESTTESYAGALALFLEWCGSIGRDWRTTAGEFGRFVHWLQRPVPSTPQGRSPALEAFDEVQAVLPSACAGGEGDGRVVLEVAELLFGRAGAEHERASLSHTATTGVTSHRVVPLYRPTNPRQHAIANSLAAVAQCGRQPTHGQQDAALDQLVVVAATAAPQQLDLQVIQRLEVGEAVEHRAG